MPSKNVGPAGILGLVILEVLAGIWLVLTVLEFILERVQS